MRPQRSDLIRKRQIGLAICTACLVCLAFGVRLKGPTFLIGLLLDAVIMGPIYYVLFVWTQRRNSA